MVAEQAAAQRSGDVNPVASPCPGAQHDPRAGRLAKKGKESAEKTVALGNIAADNSNRETSRGRGKAPMKVPDPARAYPRIEGEGNDGGGRPGTHGGEVAEVALE